MIDLAPLPRQEFACPCGASNLVNDAFVLAGMMPLLQTHCPRCQRSVLAHLRHGFVYSALTYDAREQRVQGSGNPDWYTALFERTMASRDWPAPPLQIITHKPLGRDVVLVNALDSTYGHILQRLFSIDQFKDNLHGADLVAIVPRFAAWLVPEGVAETWIVDAPLRELHHWNDKVAQAAAALAGKVDRLRLAPLRMEHYDVAIERYTRVAPYQPRSIADILPTRLTIHWREDRCWTYRGQKLDGPQAVAEQFALTTRLLDILRQEIPDLDAVITGYGNHGTFAPWIKDMRLVAHDTAREREWVHRYAASHLVMGVHGSNMILPAAHAAGSLELVPTSYWRSTVTIWQWANRMGGGEALQRFLLIPLSSSFSDIVSIAFIQLRRMQSNAIYYLRSQLRDQVESIRFDTAVASILASGSPLEYRDANGVVL